MIVNHDESKIVNLIKNLRIKYHQNACKKVKSGKLFPLSTPKDEKNFSSRILQAGKWPNFFPYFSRIRRNPG